MNKTDILDKLNFEEIIKHRNGLDGFSKEIGIKILEVSQGYAKAEIEITPKHLNPGGSVHGGCIFSLADTVGGSAAWSRGNYVVTTSSNITYLNPALESKKLIGVAKEIKYGKKILVYEVDVLDEQHRLIAKVINEYYNLGKKLDL